MFFLNGALLGVWVPHIPEMQLRLALGEGALGVALLMVPLGSVGSMPLGAWIIRTFGSRRSTLIGFFTFAGGLALALLAPVYIALAGALALFGLGNGLMDIGMNAQGVDVERARPRPIMSMLHGMYSIGNFAGAMASGALLTVGLQPQVNGVATGAAALLVGMPFAARLLKKGESAGDGESDEWRSSSGESAGDGGSRHADAAQPDRQRAAPGHADSGAPGSGEDPHADEQDTDNAAPGHAEDLHTNSGAPAIVVRHIVGFLAVLCAVAFFNLMGESAMNDWSTVYMRSVLDTPAAVAAAAYGAFAFAMAVGRFSGDRIIAATSRRFVLACGLVLAALGVATAMLAGGAAPAIGGFALAGLGLANGIPILFGAAGRLRGLREGSAMAMVMGTAYAGGIVGPPTIGFIAEAVGLQWTLLGLAAVLFLAAVASTATPLR